MANENAASEKKPASDKKATSDKKISSDKKTTSGKKTAASKKATASKKAAAGKKAAANKKAAAGKKAGSGKKKTSASKKKSPALDLTLPQNIVPLGEQNNEDKKIYISQKTYREIHRFTKDKTKVESGGVILGNVIEEFGKTHIVIRAFIEAKHCEGTPTTLKFTHESWEYIHQEAEKKYPKYKILGWIHTHPDFGIFLSEYDKFIHENFFNEENQVAYVVDPIQNIEGFYFWINGNLERCKGFFVFDKTGVKINVDQDEEEVSGNNVVYREKSSLIRNIIIGVMVMAIVILMIFCGSLLSEINSLKAKIGNIPEAMVNNQQQQISIGDWIVTLQNENTNLTNQLNSANAKLAQLQKSSNPQTEQNQGENSENGEQATEQATEQQDQQQGQQTDQQAQQGQQQGQQTDQQAQQGQQ